MALATLFKQVGLPFDGLLFYRFWTRRGTARYVRIYTAIGKANRNLACGLGGIDTHDRLPRCVRNAREPALERR